MNQTSFSIGDCSGLARKYYFWFSWIIQKTKISNILTEHIFTSLLTKIFYICKIKFRSTDWKVSNQNLSVYPTSWYIMQHTVYIHSAHMIYALSKKKKNDIRFIINFRKIFFFLAITPLELFHDMLLYEHENIKNFIILVIWKIESSVT